MRNDTSLRRNIAVRRDDKKVFWVKMHFLGFFTLNIHFIKFDIETHPMDAFAYDISLPPPPHTLRKFCPVHFSFKTPTNR